MKLNQLKFYKASDKDREKLKKYLSKEFPRAVFMATTPDNIKMTDGKTTVDQSIHNWILTMANWYQFDDPFGLYYWQGNNPIDDLIEETKEFKKNE